MKYNFFKATLFAALVMFAGYNVYSSQKSENMSDLALANVEALANDEGPTRPVFCFNYIVETDINDPKVFGAMDCDNCDFHWVNSANGEGECPAN